MKQLRCVYKETQEIINVNDDVTIFTLHDARVTAIHPEANQLLVEFHDNGESQRISPALIDAEFKQVEIHDAPKTPQSSQYHTLGDYLAEIHKWASKHPSVLDLPVAFIISINDRVVLNLIPQDLSEATIGNDKVALFDFAYDEKELQNKMRDVLASKLMKEFNDITT